MRTKVLFAALLLSATTAFAQQEKLGSGIDKTNMDLTIKPGNDFYRYAAGNWMKNHPLDAEHTDNGAFTDLFEQNQKRIQDIILEYASKPQQKGSLGQKIGSLYNLRMDSVRLNKEGWAPIKPTLDRIAAIKDRREYQLVTAQLDFRGEGTMMYGIGVGADLRDAANNLVEVGQSGLGLGVRDYYVNDDEQTKKIRDAYKAYICLALLIGASFAMPGIAASIQAGDYAGFETAASMYGGGAALGYIVIGLLAFLLGVCVTVLCFRLRQMNREDGQDKESEDAHGAD